MDTALTIIREQGTDRLTLGYLAERAGVSKPIAYEHFGTRSGLLIALYKSIDMKQAERLRAAVLATPRRLDETAIMLASAYIHCSADTSGEWHLVGAALSGSDEKDAVYQELLDNYVELFAATLAPHSRLSPKLLHARCVGLVGAGEALAAAMVKGLVTEKQATDALTALLCGGLAEAPGKTKRA